MDKGFAHRGVVTSLTIGALLMMITACSNSATNSAIPTNRSDRQVLAEVQNKLEAIAPLVKNSPMDLWWISPDGYSIINDNSPGVEAQFSGCVNDDSNYSMWTANAKKMVAAVDRVMASEGFTFDSSKNSSKNLSYSTNFNDSEHYDYIRAYFRGETKAVLSISPDCGSTMQTDNPVMYYSASFGYTNDYQKNYASQAPFLIDLNLKDVIVHIQKSEGDFSLLAVNYRRTGHATIVKRIDGKWTEIWSGQDLISCAIRNKNKIPLSIAPDCY
ncbi:MAG: hypothetical protein F2690_05625 [Actinobacteria bacterium]|uniref:Unannotated protein n=1 Tax=freshwater metagenome TaxID=449393 RepID=A0A6J5ZI82_9ZZZZ|nr:hypothetical protein [Actinomycetota bacterium]MSX72358.1 hypothetical protein [Actinomycetota bacterium]MSY70026.1 hypothetical protein [Actinomycetota bacterium]MTA76359.1 hypothetical protein [Actinomycetota bacterium]